jgi:SAM-dependent methyltransferase
MIKTKPATAAAIRKLTGMAIFRNNPDHDWERFGAEDPYYSVLNTEAYKKEYLTDALRAQVLETGETSTQTFLNFAQQLFNDMGLERALEFGCGVGRMSIALARRFQHICALDISPSMLIEAQANSQLLGVTNIEFALSDDNLSRAAGKFDFALSYLVFQHIPQKRGVQIIRQILGRLNPGGVAALHVTCYRTSSPLRQSIHIVRRNFLPLHYIANLMSGFRWNEPLMQCNLYRFERLLQIAGEQAIDQIAMQPILHGDHAGAMLYFHKRMSA